MPTTVILELMAKPGQTQALVDLMNEVLPDTLARDGCIDVTMHVNEDTPEDVMLIETWETTKQYKAYFQWRLETGFPARVDPLMQGPPKLRYYQAVPA